MPKSARLKQADVRDIRLQDISGIPSPESNLDGSGRILSFPKIQHWAGRAAEYLYTSQQERRLLREWEQVVDTLCSIERESPSSRHKNPKIPPVETKEESIEFINGTDGLFMYVGPGSEGHRILAMSPDLTEWLEKDGLGHRFQGVSVPELALRGAYRYVIRDGLLFHISQFLLQERMLDSLIKRQLDAPPKSMILKHCGTLTEAFADVTLLFTEEKKFLGTIVEYVDAGIHEETALERIKNKKIVLPTPEQLLDWGKLKIKKDLLRIKKEKAVSKKQTEKPKKPK